MFSRGYKGTINTWMTYIFHGVRELETHYPTPQIPDSHSFFVHSMHARPEISHDGFSITLHVQGDGGPFLFG